MFRRPLVPAAVMFVLGIFLAAYNANLITVTFLCVLVCLFTYVKGKNPKISVLAVALIIAGIFRMNFAEDYREKVVAEYSGITRNMKLTVTDFSSDNKVTAYFEDKKGTHNVLLTVEEGISLSPGDIIEGEIILYQPVHSKTRFSGTLEFYAGENIYLMAMSENVTKIGEKKDGLYGKIYSLRKYMNTLGEEFQGDDRALFNAMIFGDKRLLSDELTSALKASGLNHIAVVSGMHLSVAIAFLEIFARKIFGKKKRGYVFTLAGAFLLTLITGAGASVVRAFIMCCMYLVSQILRRDPDSPTSLAFAVLIMLGINPFLIFNLGFTLSVLSVMGIFLFSGKISDFLIRVIPRRLAVVVSISISAQLMVLPVSVYYFGTLAPYSLLSNVLLVPLSGIYVILGMVYIILSKVPFAPHLISQGMNFVCGIITAACYSVEKLNGSLVTIFGSFRLFFTGWIFLLVLIKMKPFTEMKRRILATVFLVSVASVLYAPKPSEVTVYSIPYGTRNMTAVENPDGDSFLIDCPSTYDMSMAENPQNPFTTVLVTRRITGTAYRNAPNVERLIVPAGVFSKKTRAELEKNAAALNLEVRFVEDFEKFRIGNVTAEYIFVLGYKRIRAVRIEYDGKSLITFQGFDGIELSEIEKKGVVYKSDYVVLPFSAAESESKIFTGEILK